MPQNMDNILKRKQEFDDNQGGYGDYSYMKLVEGPNQIRILPPAGTKENFWIERQVSFNVGPNARSIMPLKQFGKECPLIAHLEKLYITKDPEQIKQADRMWPRTRVYMWVVDRADLDSGPKLFNTNQTVFRDIVAIMADPEYGDISDAQGGTDLTVNMTPGTKTKNGFPEWQILAKRNSSPLSDNEEEMASWIADDLFEKFRVGEAPEEGWIKAAIEGTEEAYIQAKQDDNTDLPESPEQEPEPEKPSEQPELGSNKWWVSNKGGDAELVDGEAITGMLAFGDECVIMPEDQSGDWMVPGAYGFVTPEAPKPKTPPAPAKPKAPATPKAPIAKSKPKPAPVAQESDEEAELKKKLEELRKKKLENAESQGQKVADDLRSALK